MRPASKSCSGFVWEETVDIDLCSIAIHFMAHGSKFWPDELRFFRVGRNDSPTKFPASNSYSTHFLTSDLLELTPSDIIVHWLTPSNGNVGGWSGSSLQFKTKHAAEEMKRKTKIGYSTLVTVNDRVGLGSGGFCRQKNWQNSVLFLVSFIHVWYVDKEMEQNSRNCPS